MNVTSERDNKMQVFSKGETEVGRNGGSADSVRMNGPCLFLIKLDGCLKTLRGECQEI